MNFKYLILLSFLLTGCSSKHVAYRFFYNENHRMENTQNLQNEECIASGVDIDPKAYTKDRPEMIVITTYYRNCDIRTHQYLEERELPMWGLDNPYKP